jgi:hypothetical protein
MMLSNDREESQRVMNDFLTSALPEIEKCLPDWEAIKARESAGSPSDK